MLKPDFSALKRDVAESAAARARGEKWCWRCARLAEQGRGGLCDSCRDGDKSLLPQLAQPNYHKWIGRKNPDAAPSLSPEEQRELARIARRKQRKFERREAARMQAQERMNAEMRAKAARMVEEFNDDARRRAD